MGRKTAKAYKLSLMRKFENTRPELALQKLCGDAGIKVFHPEPIWISATEQEGLDWHEYHMKIIQKTGWEITPDFNIKDSHVLLECDGIYHSTKIQRRKSQWRDNQLISRGFRVLHIPSSLLIAEGVKDRKKFWPFVKEEIEKFLASKDSVKYVVA